MKRPLALPIAALLLVFAAPAFAGTPINEVRAVNPDARIDISNVKGEVDVSAWDKSEVAIGGTLGAGSRGLSVTGGADHLVIKVEPPANQGWFSWGADTRMEDSTLEIKVPRAAELKIDVVSARVGVVGVAGRSLAVNSVSGKLKLDSGARELEIDTVSGDVVATGSATRSHIETVSGDVRAAGLTGQIKLETVSGELDATVAQYNDFNAGSVSGNIVLRGKPATGAHLDVGTMSGDVRLSLPADASARIHAETFSGRISSDFGTVKEPEHGPGSSLDTTTGSGDARVQVKSFSGDVEIRKDGSTER